MSEEQTRTAESREPPKGGSSLQAILHRGAGGMETIGVPLPLPDVVVRVQERPADEGAGATSPAYVDQFFRRVRSSDSVVRYYEHEASAPADASTRASRTGPRTCGACGGQSECYFIRTSPIDAVLSAETEAHCATCYAAAAR